MVNNPNSTPPAGQGPQGPNSPHQPEKTPPNGAFQSTGKEHRFVGMTFTAKEWTKLMNIMVKSLSDYINKTYQKMTEKMKKDWKRGSGDDSED